MSTKASTLRKRLDESKSDLEDLRTDLESLRAHEQERKRELSEAIRAGASLEVREDLTQRHSNAEMLVIAQVDGIHALEQEIQDLAGDLAQVENAKARDAAIDDFEKRLTTFKKHSADLRDKVYEPIWAFVREFRALEDAREKAADLGARSEDLQAVRLHRWLEWDSNMHRDGEADFLRGLLARMHALRASTGGLTDEEREEMRAEAQRRSEERTREARRTMLERLRERKNTIGLRPDDAERIRVLEAEFADEPDLDEEPDPVPETAAESEPEPELEEAAA